MQSQVQMQQEQWKKYIRDNIDQSSEKNTKIIFIQKA